MPRPITFWFNDELAVGFVGNCKSAFLHLNLIYVSQPPTAAMAKWILFSTVFNIILGFAFAGNNFTYTGTPVPGEPFTITWTPDTYATVDILLNHLTGYPYYVPTTSVPIVGMC